MLDLLCGRNALYPHPRTEQESPLADSGKNLGAQIAFADNQPFTHEALAERQHH